jgi:DNA-binding GntR family transcriptional regulator
VPIGDRADQISRDSPALLSDQVAADLVTLIDHGALTGRLPAEVDLADAYQVGRVTVRTAIATLVAAGRLRVVRGRGTFIVGDG